MFGYPLHSYTVGKRFREVSFMIVLTVFFYIKILRK